MKPQCLKEGREPWLRQLGPALSLLINCVCSAESLGYKDSLQLTEPSVLKEQTQGRLLLELTMSFKVSSNFAIAMLYVDGTQISLWMARQMDSAPDDLDRE